MNRAFTLIEMLIAISIAMVLAALIAAGTRSSIAAANRTKAISNLGQILTAMHLYATDNNEYFPPGYDWKGAGKVEKTYSSELLPYMDAKTNYLNAASNPFVSPTSLLRVKSNAEYISSTYSVHGLLCGDTSVVDNRIKRNRVIRPTEVILIGEGCQSPTSRNASATFRFPSEFKSADSPQDLNTKISVGPDSDTADGAGWLRYRSGGGAVVGMVDGHCAVMPKGSVTYRNVIADR